MNRIILLIIVFSVNCFAQFQKTDAEIAGLKGKVKEVSSGQTYDPNGYLISESYAPESIDYTPAGNCDGEIKQTVLTFQRRTLKKEIQDFSNSANCTIALNKEKEYLQIPKPEIPGLSGKNVSFFDQFINYELIYTTSDTSEDRNFGHIAYSQNKFIEVVARAGKLFAGRTNYIFDEKLRLIEELHVRYDLTFYSAKYFYEPNREFPISIESYRENMLTAKEMFQYDKFDKEGNWIKITITPQIVGGGSQRKPFTQDRIITYYENPVVVK